MPCNVSVRGAFQLTPSARRATRSRPFGPAMPENFNPRPPRGGRPGGGLKNAFTVFISIHALREEGDAALTIFFSLWAISIHALREEATSCHTIPPNEQVLFQSTPSVGKATGQAQDPGTRQAISIRNLHMEGDYRQADCLRRGIHDFNPRSPWGERLCTAFSSRIEKLDFNPRSPWGGRRCTGMVMTAPSEISIHALRGEGDHGNRPAAQPDPDFNPRPPWGGRRKTWSLSTTSS